MSIKREVETRLTTSYVVFNSLLIEEFSSFFSVIICWHRDSKFFSECIHHRNSAERRSKIDFVRFIGMFFAFRVELDLVRTSQFKD